MASWASDCRRHDTFAAGNIGVYAQSPSLTMGEDCRTHRHASELPFWYGTLNPYGLLQKTLLFPDAFRSSCWTPHPSRLLEEIRIKAFEASRKARMSISKYSNALMLHSKVPWSRRNSPAFNGGPSEANGDTNFDRHRKRRQSAPVISIDMNGKKR